MPDVSAKPARSVFACSECGFESPKWLGACPDCSVWNSLLQSAPRPAAGRLSIGAPATAIEISALEEEPHARTPLGIPELDRVLGGGLVAGSLVLVGGDPGIGKSTLLLQAAALSAAAGRTA